MDEWWATCKVKSRLFMVEKMNEDGATDDETMHDDFYQEDNVIGIANINDDVEVTTLFDSAGPMEEVPFSEFPASSRTNNFINDDSNSNDSNDLEDEEFLSYSNT